AASVLADRRGTIWVANEGALDSISGGHVSSLQKRQGLPGGAVTALLEDHAGRLWVGVDNRLSIYEHGAFRQINRGEGSPLGAILMMTEDRENNIWAITVQPRKLVRIADFGVREEIPVSQVPEANSMTADTESGIWLGLSSGDLARYRNGQLETFRFTDTQRPVWGVVVTPEGATLGATNHGLIGWRNGTLRTLTIRNGLPCDGVYAAIFDTHRGLWLYTQCGLVKIADADLQRWWEQADASVAVKVFDAL